MDTTAQDLLAQLNQLDQDIQDSIDSLNDTINALKGDS
jgi:uncharacterized protein YoxC